ncbi:hypothetical protein AB0E67_12475 [Streptomyces sp. NPDC032161]|uniref:hypothetical protein n=1 Tax=unclassified Streptomyces TaxID=2593676 RepID=UPI003411D71F
MEQRIDPNTQPGYAAGTDPAYIPGLTAPVTAGKPAPGRGQQEQEQEQAEEPAPAAIAVDEAPAEAEAEAESRAETEDEADGAADDAEAAAEDAAPGSDGKEKGQRPEDGPVFEVSDRRGAITVNHEGVRFRLDDQEADFDWDEIGAVEVKTPRFGRRFTVTVHLATRRWFNAEVEAPARSDLKQWAEQLDAALDAYFEES